MDEKTWIILLLRHRRGVTRTAVSTGARPTGSLIDLALGADEASWTVAEVATSERVIVSAGAVVLAGL